MKRALLPLLAFICQVLAACSTSTPGNPVVATDRSHDSGAATSSQPASPVRRCLFTPTPDDPAAKPVGLPEARTTDPLPASLVLRTSRGDIRIKLDTTAAPCTVHSMAFLARAKFFDGSPCHRLTTVDGLKVLQCGDPSGTGSGGPGYTIPDENPTTLPPAPQGSNLVVYPRGTVAMANRGEPNSGGSQFFLVYQDSILPPTYAVFGTVDPNGLGVLDGIAAAGVNPAGAYGPDDGAPNAAVTITQVVVGN